MGGALALFVERVVFKRIYEKDITFTIISSFGLLIASVGGDQGCLGPGARPVPVIMEIQVPILGTEIPLYRLLVIVIAALVYVGIWAFLNKTIIEKAIRAGIEDVEKVAERVIKSA